jgi:UDP-N-acetylglucosamine--N-acetylmuramyl-(pentapeptide) pyrophosphoryl-undecaprenol N-acetylglucosamine transferase
VSAGPPERVDLLFATGGTGGHIYPALAVAAAARERGLEAAFLGQSGGMEATLVPEAGFPFTGVAAGKWDRQRPDPLQALRAGLGLVQAIGAVRASRPALVVGFGGFASFPGCAAALLTGTALALHEGNAFPSRVTRWFASRARLVVLAQAEAGAHLRARKVVLVPFPVREVRVDRARARDALGLAADAPVTLVMGGSQGSLALNRAVPEAYRELGRGDVQVVHAAGARWVDALRRRVADLPGYHVHPFVDAAQAFAAADLAITRAGIGTLSEAAFHGVPLVMVPLPTAAEDHQLHNAQAVAAAGAGLTVPESELDRLPETWRRLLEPHARIAAAQAAAARSPEGAARRILDALAPYLERSPARPAGVRRTAP